jgi:hypothetical protein
MSTTSHIKVLDANLDDEVYSKIVSDKNIEVQANETLMPKTGEPLIVLKYTKKVEDNPELKVPILGF